MVIELETLYGKVWIENKYVVSVRPYDEYCVDVELLDGKTVRIKDTKENKDKIWKKNWT